MDEGPRKEEPSVALIIRACDMCRKKKIRCDVVADTCAQCIKYKTPCHFTPISMKRTPRRSPKDRSIQDLEQRLKRMEDQLKRAVAAQPRAEYQVENAFELPETANSDYFQAEAYQNQQMEVDTSLNEPVVLVEMSPQSMGFGQPFQNTAPKELYENQIASFSLWNNGRSSNILHKPLPPVDKGLALVEKSFRGFNCVFPIFDRENFLFEYHKSESNLDDPCWWACLNVVLALSHRFTGMTITEEDQDQEAWEYFQNAMAASNQLITMAPSIQSVQALIGMALLSLGTPHQDSASLLISSAIKSAQRMGLHRSYEHSTLKASEIEQQKRIFWSAYMIDKDLSLMTGQPPTQDDDDMDVGLPSESNSKDLGIFFLRVRLAIIQGQIYKDLCSVRARRQPPTERIMVARKLETMLQSWKAEIPAGVLQENHRPGHDGVCSVILRLAYFNSLSTVYNSLPVLPMYHELAVPQHPGITYDARKAIELLEVTPRRSHACLWAVLPIYVTASTVLLTYTLSKPSNESATFDLKLSQSVLHVLVALARISKGQREEVTEMYRSSVDLFEKARMAIEISNMDLFQSSQSQEQFQSAPEGQKESVEDFLTRMESLGSAGYEHFDLDLLSPKTLGWVESHNKRR